MSAAENYNASALIFELDIHNKSIQDLVDAVEM